MFGFNVCNLCGKYIFRKSKTGKDEHGKVVHKKCLKYLDYTYSVEDLDMDDFELYVY